MLKRHDANIITWLKRKKNHIQYLNYYFLKYKEGISKVIKILDCSDITIFSLNYYRYIVLNLYLVRTLKIYVYVYTYKSIKHPIIKDLD